ncbi:hypothetical protein [Mailhella massiliensis]|uniref:hypothetical protein n=1 Tax=Mailhella massiliensis TaxID=1903261 RepID=UPI0012B56F8D|nr:hypothetical protein [Mailhella massiliensis]
MFNAFRFSEDKLLRLGTCLVGLTVLFTVAVLAFCNGQDEELAAHGVNLQQMVEVR